MISTVISFSSLEARFLPTLLTETSIFSDDIHIIYYTNFFDGTPENLPLIHNLRHQYPAVTWHELEWTADCDPKWCHNQARWVGAEAAKEPWTLFLDADEIPDGTLIRKNLPWLTSTTTYAFHIFSCYWYFRSPTFRATTTEHCGLLAHMPSLTKEMFFTNNERWFFFEYKDIPWFRRLVVNTEKGEPMLHHFSWVRTKEEMLRKVKSWAHRNDRSSWTDLVEEEFKRPFMGKDFVHGYSYTKVDNRWGINV